ncbi:hypothetical protein N7522_006270 [Penicillium canescens]|nr:hypothetical protein N7522_006270 [Penicillium canescens]
MTYLDHPGTTLFAKSFIQSFSDDIMSNHYPMLVSSQRSTRRIDYVRFQVLQFFNANPNEFDLVFVANVTAAIKLIGDLFRDADPGRFCVIGVRELTDINSQCFDDADVEAWITELSTAQSQVPKLFAFPAQSNMNGRRLPLRWCAQLRSVASQGGDVSTLLDASSFLSTAPLDFGEASTAPNTAPDFTALSFHKIFGFPDLGALIVRKSQWHAKKDTSIHEQLNNDTLPFQSIIVLDAAIKMHKRLYGSMSNSSAHTGFLAQRLYDQLTEIEEMAAVRNIQLRCSSDYNPRGTTLSLGWTGEELRRHAAGLRCGDDHDVSNRRTTGILRVSLGAMTKLEDIDSLTKFMEEFYVEKVPPLVPLAYYQTKPLRHGALDSRTRLDTTECLQSWKLSGESAVPHRCERSSCGVQSYFQYGQPHEQQDINITGPNMRAVTARRRLQE